MRCTCRNSPAFIVVLGEFRMVMRGREVVPQEPMVASGSVAASLVPERVSMLIGTSIAMVFTL